MPIDPFFGTALSAAANLGGGLFSAFGQQQANAANLAQQNMINNQMLKAQMAQHEQNTAFMEDQQNFNREERQYAENFNASEAEKNRLFNSTEARINREFQYMMGTSAYQRAMQDMKKAGLNPILAYQQGGAPMAQGSMASGTAASVAGASSGMASGPGAPHLSAAHMQNDKEAIGRALGNLVSNAVDTQKTLQGVELMKNQTRTEDMRWSEVEQRTGALREQKFRTNAEIDLVKQQTKNQQIENDIKRANASSAWSRASIDARAARDVDRYGSAATPGIHERVSRTIQNRLEEIPPPLHWDPKGPRGEGTTGSHGETLE